MTEAVVLLCSGVLFWVKGGTHDLALGTFQDGKVRVEREGSARFICTYRGPNADLVHCERIAEPFQVAEGDLVTA